MARLPTQKRILTEDFPGQREWIPRLLDPLNKFMEDVQRALNRQITINENLSGEIKTAVIDGTYPVKLPWSLNTRPIAAWLGQCRESDNVHTTITTALYLDWEYNEAGQFQINNIAGLSASSSNKFNASIVIITG